MSTETLYHTNNIFEIYPHIQIYLGNSILLLWPSNNESRIKIRLKFDGLPVWSTFRQHFFLNSEKCTIFFDPHKNFHPFFSNDQKMPKFREIAVAGIQMLSTIKRLNEFPSFSYATLLFWTNIKDFHTFQRSIIFFPSYASYDEIVVKLSCFV